jgi:DNA-binding transcriptional LysR family regulator
MFSIKQIEVFVWTARLGAVQHAAERLHISPSAASKRLRDLELSAAVPLFAPEDRQKQHLTAKGREMLALCEDLLGTLRDLEDRSGRP